MKRPHLTTAPARHPSRDRHQGKWIANLAQNINEVMIGDAAPFLECLGNGLTRLVEVDATPRCWAVR